jgi:hypothetical protein
VRVGSPSHPNTSRARVAVERRLGGTRLWPLPRWQALAQRRTSALSPSWSLALAGWVDGCSLSRHSCATGAGALGRTGVLAIDFGAGYVPSDTRSGIVVQNATAALGMVRLHASRRRNCAIAALAPPISNISVLPNNWIAVRGSSGAGDDLVTLRFPSTICATKDLEFASPLREPARQLGRGCRRECGKEGEQNRKEESWDHDCMVLAPRLAASSAMMSHSCKNSVSRIWLRFLMDGFSERWGLGMALACPPREGAPSRTLYPSKVALASVSRRDRRENEREKDEVV